MNSSLHRYYPVPDSCKLSSQRPGFIRVIIPESLLTSLKQILLYVEFCLLGHNAV
jgi:hypothetical protein